jgi:glycosyltransferase involved in cell wall biosynthesis
MSSFAPSVDILLATYNGERFLAAQLESLERQTFRSWRLLVRDDGSKDGTRAVLEEFRARHPEAVHFIEDGDSRLGAAGNYGRLLAASTADYALFCDQDDVWLPDKIESLLVLAVAHERPDHPLLIHSDLEVVDSDLRVRESSFWRYQFIRPERCEWSRLLVQNVVTGCASLINAPLRRAALPIPAEAVMHDWWLALVAAVSGEIKWTEKVTVRYRQHDSNDTGAKRWGVNHWLNHSDAVFRSTNYREKTRAYQRQAAALAAHHVGMSESIRRVAAEFSELDRMGYLQRVRFVRRHEIMKTGVLRNLMWLRNL